MVHFAHPWAWLALAALPAAAWLEWRWRRWRRRRLESYAESASFLRLMPREVGRPGAMSWWLWMLAVVCLITAAARPQGAPEETIQTRRPVLNVFFVLDVSTSMRAEDVRPSRLGLARRTLEGILAALPQARAGLIVFAGEARVTCPATFDHEAFSTVLDRVSAGMLGAGGSKPAPAVNLAMEKLEHLEGDGRAVVLLSDGETHDSSGLSEIGLHAAARDIPIVTLGVGTLEGGHIPMGKDFWGQAQVRRYRGEPVRTRLVSLGLRKAATFSGGAYFDAGADPAAAAEAARRLTRWTREALRRRAVTVRREYFAGFLAAGIGLLWLAAWLPAAGGASRRFDVSGRPAAASARRGSMGHSPGATSRNPHKQLLPR